MNFLQKLLQGIAFVPTIVNSIEGLSWQSYRGAEERVGDFVCGGGASAYRIGFQSRDCGRKNSKKG
jgi:hypothetical protein